MLASKLKQDADDDRNRGRRHLAEFLYETKDGLAQAAASADLAWKICAPYMPATEDGEKPAPE